MNETLKIFFADNPYIAEQVCAFCNTFPEFREAERDFEAVSEQIAEILGRNLYLLFEQAQSWYMAKLANAYYLFGLELRQEVLTALQSEMT